MSRLALTIRPVAQEEIDHHADYLAVHAGAATAERFLAALAATLDLISRSPGIGGPWISQHPQLQGIRKCAIDRFPRFLLYYRHDERKLEVLHLFHGSQDIRSRLEHDDTAEDEPRTDG